MIIRSIRLKNIKSYGEGEDGNGITVTFLPRVNRIAGRNGHGKTTLIESLGYALFLADPLGEERFEVGTYFVRSGKSCGEIDVVFEFEGEGYRVERGVGTKNTRRAKVVLLRDGSIEAEGDDAVADFLCRLFRLPGADRLREVFTKLVGVKQGRLALPFDSKPQAARNYFEPLLDVEVFSRCFDDLKPVVDRFGDLRVETEKEMAGVDERIRDRADSREKVAARRQEADRLSVEVEQAGQEHVQATARCVVQEQKEQREHTARQAFEHAAAQLKLASQQRENLEKQVQESRAAEETVAATRTAHDAWCQAEDALRQLQLRQHEKTRLAQQRALVDKERVTAEGKALTARSRAKDAGSDRDQTGVEAAQLREGIQACQLALEASRSGFEQLRTRTERAQKAQHSLQDWAQALGGKIEANARRAESLLELAAKLAGWDPKRLEEARGAERAADAVLDGLTRELGRVENLAETLSGQLQEIRGGVCPFLKEQCRQFDPAKIRAEIGTHEQERKRLGKERQTAARALQDTKARAEQLAREEAALGELRRNVGAQVVTFAEEHNGLIPAAVKEHFGALGVFLPVQVGSLCLPVLTEAGAGLLVDETGAVRTAALRGLVGEARELGRGVATVLDLIAGDFKDAVGAFERERQQRGVSEQQLNNKRENLKKAGKRIQDLGVRIEQFGREAELADRAVRGAIETLAVLDRELLPLAGLEEAIKQQQAIKDQWGTAHQQYLGSKPVADRLTEREAALAAQRLHEGGAADVVRLKQAGLDEARSEFDSAALATARKQVQDATARLAEVKTRLDNSRTELRREEVRLAEWTDSCRQGAVLRVRRGRLEACLDLTGKAREILKKSAAKVAAHLCARIAARAQQIYNQISPDPVEISWPTDRYSVRIDPGDRRFAMLSGGEQTKLALAMTLAMIQEFGGLKLCIFDEPTYGVDADSRKKLAEAIVKAPEAAQFDQLILVSHDDAFEGQVENTVLLTKTAGAGSRVQVGSS
jgi:exonuclease SbcC